MILTHSIPLKQTDRTCWWIQIEMDKLNRFKCRTWHELDSLWMFCCMWSSMFKLGLGIILVHRCCFMWTTGSLPSWWVFLYFPLWNVISTNGVFSEWSFLCYVWNIWLRLDNQPLFTGRLPTGWTGRANFLNTMYKRNVWQMQIKDWKINTISLSKKAQ